MDAFWVALLTSGVSAAVVSGAWNFASDRRREDREDAGFHRLLRAEAKEVAANVLIFRKFGFGSIERLTVALSSLAELLRDPTVHRALNDESSAAITEASNLGDLFIQTYNSHRLGDYNPPYDHVQQQEKASAAVQPTLKSLRAFFEADGADDMLATIDEAEVVREALLKTRRGLT